MIMPVQVHQGERWQGMGASEGPAGSQLYLSTSQGSGAAAIHARAPGRRAAGSGPASLGDSQRAHKAYSATVSGQPA